MISSFIQSKEKLHIGKIFFHGGIYRIVSTLNWLTTASNDELLQVNSLLSATPGRHIKTYSKNNFVWKKLVSQNACLIFLECSHKHLDFCSHYTIAGPCSGSSYSFSCVCLLVATSNSTRNFTVQIFPWDSVRTFFRLILKRGILNTVNLS